MQVAELLDIKNIYLQNKVAKFPRAQQIVSRFPEARIIEIYNHWDLFSDREDLVDDWNSFKKHNIVVGFKSKIDFQENGRSSDYIAASHANGCAMSCVYCYVPRRKGYANPITVFGNIEQITNGIRLHSESLRTKVPNQCDPKYWLYDIGCNNDASVDALISDNVKDIIELFTGLPNAKASFATKYVNRDLLDYDPKRKTRIRFSVMPEKIAKILDVRTSPMSERIEAINDFYEAGYEVHLNFSPVVIYDNWEQDYMDLMDEIDDKISDDVKLQLGLEVIFLTHNEEMHKINLRWHPKGENLIWDPEKQEPKTSMYGGNNLRYRYDLKSGYIQTFKNFASSKMPYANIRYIF